MAQGKIEFGGGVLLNLSAPASRIRRLLLFLTQLLLLSYVVGQLADQLHSYGPTLGDPDPDGYISYANALKETWAIQPHRRLPGYPLIVVLVDSFGIGSIAVKMFWFHLILTVAFVAVTAGLVWRFFGYSVAFVYSMLMAYNSYFARDAIIMVADLPLVVAFYMACAIGLAFLKHSNKFRLLYAALFFAACIISIAIHPSAHMLLQILIFCACIVFAIRQMRIVPSPERIEKAKRILMPFFVLSILAFAGKGLVANIFQVNGQQDYLHHPDTAVSSQNFLKSWIGFRMLLCFPPGQQSDAIDARIEEVKSKVSTRIGYPVESVVPPGYYKEFLPLLDGKSVEVDRWKNRALQHPLEVFKCAASEFRAKYNILVKNLTPFTGFEHDKTWVTHANDYPAKTASPRDDLFWSTGINLLRVLPSDATAQSVASAAKVEVARMILIIALTFGGLMMIGRAFPGVGLVLIGSQLIWVCALPVALPLETRYLMVFFPVIYTGQAIFMVWVLAYIWKLASKAAGIALLNRARK